MFKKRAAGKRNDFSLTPRESAFLKEFLANGRKAPQAYCKTGGPQCGKDPTKSSTQIKSYSFLRRPRIKDALKAADQAVAERAKQHIAEKYGATKERVIEELAKIAFTDVSDVTTWDENGVKTKNSADLTEAEKASVAEVIETKKGVKVKLADKQKALEGLGKALGIFKEERSGGPQLAVQFIIERD